MTDTPALTLLLGPQTDLSLALNALIRDQRAVLAQAGLVALPSRIASPVVRRAVNARPATERAQEFADETRECPAILSAVNFFGPPHAGMIQREMFPEAEALLLRLSEVVSGVRVVLSIDSLPAFFMASGSKPLEARVQKTTWETLYDLSWADLAKAIQLALPNADLVVLTPKAALTASTLTEMLGTAAHTLPDDLLLFRAILSETGRAVLDRLPPNGRSETVLADLYSSFARRPSEDEAAERLGIDKVTFALLEQRFEEDLAALQAMSGIRVLA